LQVVDAGRQLIVNQINGFLQGRVVQFLMNLHTSPRKIYFSRHGQSEYNLLHKIGGNSNLTEQGKVRSILDSSVEQAERLQ
jgi:6-phosphofructo-2-kinase/fructose-2,6-biphosphatase 2